MGGSLGNIFGGGYEAPEHVSYDPLPSRGASVEPEAESVRDTERRRLKARRGASSTILTSPLGTSGKLGGGILSSLNN